ncbi:MAG TPA: AtpZ/AtpI family protein [Hyphomicrobiaceae bacterium]|nr:AtpZ/AtpI family protein [Hyphomicrobiaceae bacterium]
MSNSSNGQDHNGGKLSPQEIAHFEHRVSELNKKLGKVRAGKIAKAESQGGSAVGGRGMSYGFKIGSEFVGAILVGAAIGYGLDYLLGTKPWLALAFFLLGFAAGVLNVMRGYQQLQGDIERQTGANIGKDLPDDDD